MPTPPSGTARGDYEELRAYVLAPIKTPSRPLGLDLWNKKGFLAWSLVSFHHTPPPACAKHSTSGGLQAPSALVIPLTNIISDWSNRYARLDDEF
jgi:hypothetical protein